MISDGTFPTTAITHWTRDRTRGEQIDLEFVVHQQTQRTAAHVGWHDRGVIAPGYLADLNVIDHDRLALQPPRLVDDLPAGGTRLMQSADGYVATIKRGRVTAENGALTGDARAVSSAAPAPPPDLLGPEPNRTLNDRRGPGTTRSFTGSKVLWFAHVEPADSDAQPRGADRAAGVGEEHLGSGELPAGPGHQYRCAPRRRRRARARSRRHR